MGTSIENIIQSFDTLMQRAASLRAKEALAIEVTMSQVQLLYVVATRPDVTMSALAAQLNVGLSAVSGLVERLVERSYLERREDPTDRRQHLVSLTPSGREVMLRLHELNDALLRRLLSGLSGQELAALDSGLAALARQAAVLTADNASIAPEPSSDRRSP